MANKDLQIIVFMVISICNFKVSSLMSEKLNNPNLKKRVAVALAVVLGGTAVGSLATRSTEKASQSDGEARVSQSTPKGLDVSRSMSEASLAETTTSTDSKEKSVRRNPIRTSSSVATTSGEKTKSSPTTERKEVVTNASDRKEPVPVPAESRAYMDRNAIFIHMDNPGGSGSIIRNASGEAIGVKFAEHAGFRGDAVHKRYQSSDGKNRLSVSPVSVKQGASTDSMREIGKLNSFLLPKTGDTRLDYGFGAFEGHTPEEVQAADNSLSAAEISSLKAGDKLYFAGYPEYHPNSADRKLQHFGAITLGVAEARLSDGYNPEESVKVLWTAVSGSTDDAEARCSKGSSSSEGFVMQNGKARPVGVLAAGYELIPGLYNSEEDVRRGKEAKKWLEDSFGVNLDGYSSACAFAFEQPQLGSTGELVYPEAS